MGLQSIKLTFQQLIQEGNISLALNKWDDYVRGELNNPIQHCLKLLPKRKEYTVIDIGSNTGVFIEELLKRINIKKAVLFEPVPTYVEWSKEKFAEHSEVQIINYALSDKTESKTLYYSNQNLGWNTFIKEKINEENQDNELFVKCKSFDKINEEELLLDSIDLIKIDTEGFEYKVLGGMIKTLQEIGEKPLIICEIGWGNNSPHIDELREVLEKIRKIGYNIPNIDFSNTQDIFLTPCKG